MGLEKRRAPVTITILNKRKISEPQQFQYEDYVNYKEMMSYQVILLLRHVLQLDRKRITVRLMQLYRAVDLPEPAV